MQHISPRYIAWIATIIAISCNQERAYCQLQITEVMYDSVDDANWEWFEIRNTGATDIDLDGYFVDDLGSAIAMTASPNIWNISNGGMATNTVIPAGRVAVLYDGTALGFDDARFRSAWQLAPTIPLIGVRSPPGLNNSGDMFGLWPNRTSYDADTRDVNGTFDVTEFTNATLSLDFTPQNGFPDGEKFSIAWNGMGSFRDGAQWAVSESGINGATTSIATFLPGMDQLNSIDDRGNPGKVPDMPQTAGLFISELMFNPASDDAGWEWIEVYNNTGATIDFSTTPFVLDDIGGAALTVANVNAGTIANGTAAVLFDAGTTVEQMKTAWGADNNYVPVTAWSALNNGGDTIGIWNGAGPNYQDDKANDVFDAAMAAVTYADSGDWPSDDGKGSIYLSSLALPANIGTSWVLSSPEDTFSFNAAAVFTGGQPADHIGGDVGSPGIGPGNTPPTKSADFNGDTLVNCEDINLLYAEVAKGENLATFDLNEDALVNGDDIGSFLQESAAAQGFSQSIRPGDANLNGRVDAADLNTVGVNWLSSTATSWCGGDFNHDGNVNASDLNDLGVNWLSDITGAAASNAAVPEPAGDMLLVITGLLMVVASRKW